MALKSVRMKLSEYFSDRGRQASLACSLRIPASLLSAWASGDRPVPIPRCAVIERATGGAVTRADLLPDDYWLIWPDLPAPKATPADAQA